MLLITAAENLPAQDFSGGTVKYRQTKKYDFVSIFDGFDDPIVEEWAATLPTERQRMKVLYFTENEALYEEDITEQEVLSEKLQWAYSQAEYLRPPSTELQKVYYDFRKNERLEQVGFMTRDFLISDKIGSVPWRLTNKSTKILDYTCLGAELKLDERSVTAWFASEIPISAGPDRFYGLPGLILAVEVNGETAFLATSVDLAPPAEGLLSKPDEGRKIAPKKLQKIMEEKIMEYEATRSDHPHIGRRRR
jgi:GLPGLI family protein